MYLLERLVFLLEYACNRSARGAALGVLLGALGVKHSVFLLENLVYLERSSLVALGVPEPLRALIGALGVHGALHSLRALGVHPRAVHLECSVYLACSWEYMA